MSLAAGLRLRGVPVRVHEAGHYPRHRVCGEFISGVGGTTLESLGIAGALDDARQHDTVAWFREGREIFRGALPVPALGISRQRLDLRLMQRVLALGGEIEEGSRIAREARDGMVWAAGRIARPGSWIGLKCHFEGLELHADLEMHLGSGGYLGLAGIEDGKVNACGLFRVDVARRARGVDLLYRYLTAVGNAALVQRLRQACCRDESFSAVAGFELGRQVAEPGLCTIGDAECIIPPFTGNGMSMAFQSAEVAIEPLVRWSRGDGSWPECRSEIRRGLRERFQRRLKVAAALHPVILRRAGGAFIELLSRSGALPFHPLLALVR